MTLVIKDGNGSPQSIHTQTLAGELAQVVALAVGATSTITAIAQSTTDGVLLAANTARISAKIYNASTSGNLEVSLGSVVTATNYTVLLAPGSFFEVSDFNGVIHGAWDTAGSGHALVTEITP